MREEGPGDTEEMEPDDRARLLDELPPTLAKGFWKDSL